MYEKRLVQADPVSRAFFWYLFRWGMVGSHFFWLGRWWCWYPAREFHLKTWQECMVNKVVEDIPSRCHRPRTEYVGIVWNCFFVDTVGYEQLKKKNLSFLGFVLGDYSTLGIFLVVARLWYPDIPKISANLSLVFCCFEVAFLGSNCQGTETKNPGILGVFVNKSSKKPFGLWIVFTFLGI